MVVDDWSPHLPTYVDPHLSLLCPENQQVHSDELDEEGDNNQYLGGITCKIDLLSNSLYARLFPINCMHWQNKQ